MREFYTKNAGGLGPETCVYRGLGGTPAEPSQLEKGFQPHLSFLGLKATTKQPMKQVDAGTLTTARSYPQIRSKAFPLQVLQVAGNPEHRWLLAMPR